MREHKIEISREKCNGCGMCQKDCPAYNIEIKDKKAEVRTQNCIMCGHCAALCPRSAILITGFEETPVEINDLTLLDPEQLMNAIRTRRSIRQYKDQPVSPEIVSRIIEAGRLTPSGGNAQDVSYIVLQDELEYFEDIGVKIAKRLLPLVKLVSATARNAVIDDHFFFKKAPAAILVVSKDKVNASLAASNMELMAQAYGLGVLYSGFFAKIANLSPKIRRLLKLSHTQVVTVLVIGYPNVKYRRTVQKEPATVMMR